MKARHPVTFTMSDLHAFADCKVFDRLFSEWERSGYNKQRKPSIDRISNKRGYDLDNIHWMTWAENRYKQTMERRVRGLPVLQLSAGKVVARFPSQREAVRATGLSQSNMSSALNGHRKLCGGYEWRFENPHLLPKA